jgi:hypothetical protein
MRDFWNQRYSEADYAYGTEPNAYFKSIIDGLKPGKLLVPGAGEGRDAVYAASLGWDVLAYDASEAGRNKAMLLAEQKKVTIRYQVRDVRDFLTGEKFNAIASIFFHLPLFLRQTMHRNLPVLLASGAHIIIESFTPTQLHYTSGGPRDLDMLVSAKQLEEELNWLEVRKLSEQQIQLDEGLYHKGAAHVVRFHGVKY